MNRIIKNITYLGLFLIMMPLFRPFSINYTYSDILLGISFILILIIKNKKMQINLFGNQMNNLLYYLGVLLLFIGFSISTIVNGASFNYLIIIIQYIMVFIIVPLVIKNSNINLKSSIHTIINSMIVVIMFGIYIYFFTADVSYSIGGRMGSLFKNPNTFAKNISLLIPLVFFLIYKFRDKKAWIILPVFTIGLMIASSFGGIIASFLSMLIFLMFSKESKGLFKALVIMLISTFLFITIFGLPEIFENRILGIQNELELENMGSYSQKTELMYESLNLINDNPLIGVGLGNYTDNVAGYSTVHNTYLLIWSEGGMFSIIGLLIIFMSFFMKIIRNYKDKYYLAAGMSIFLIMSLNMITNVHMYNRYSFIALFLLLFLNKKNVMH